MNPMTPAAVQFRELHRQELLETAAREHLALAAVPRTRPQIPLHVSLSVVAASVRSEVISRLSLLGQFARVATTTGRPLSRASPWN
jgi:hypothetical protein